MSFHSHADKPHFKEAQDNSEMAYCFVMAACFLPYNKMDELGMGEQIWKSNFKDYCN